MSDSESESETNSVWVVTVFNDINKKYKEPKYNETKFMMNIVGRTLEEALKKWSKMDHSNLIKSIFNWEYDTIIEENCNHLTPPCGCYDYYREGISDDLHSIEVEDFDEVDEENSNPNSNLEYELQVGTNKLYFHATKHDL
jgi:hypothetical protein